MALVIPKRTDKPKSGLVIPERKPSKATVTPVVKSNLPSRIKTVGGKPSLAMNPSQKEQTIKPYIPPRPLGFFGDMIKGAFDSVKGQFETTARLNTKAVESLMSGNKDVVERAKQSPLAPEYLKKQSTPLERAVNLGVAGVSTAGTVVPQFVAFGAELEAAKSLPGPLGAPAKAFGYGLEKLSELGSFSANKGIDALPVSEDTKNAMRPVADEIAPLVSQLVGMKVVGSVSGGKAKLDKNGEPLPKTKVGNAVDKSKFAVSLSLQPFSTAYGLVGARVASKVAEKQQNGIDITPEVGKQIVEEVKQEIQTQGIPDIDNQGSIKPQQPQISEQIKVPETIETVVPNPKTNKFESRVFKRMKEEHPFSLSDEGNLNYESINLKDQARKAVELVGKDKAKAYKIATGIETSKDITSTAVNIALSEKALSEGNFDLYSKLIKNRSLEQTRRGQEIVSERASVSDNSTSHYVKKLIASRLDKLGDRYLSGLSALVGKKTTSKYKATKIIDSEVKKAQSKIKNKEIDIKEAQSIIDKLSC